MSAPEALKTALRYNGMSSPAQLVALGRKRALRQPMVGPKVWEEALRQTSEELLSCLKEISPPLGDQAAVHDAITRYFELKKNA